MKVAVLVSEFPSRSETFIVNQIIGYLELGHSVSIFSWSSGSSMPYKLVEDFNLLPNTTYLIYPTLWQNRVQSVFKLLFSDFTLWLKLVPTLNLFRFRREAISLRLFASLHSFTKLSDADIIHAHFGPNGRLIALAREFDILPRNKFVTSIHGYDILPEFAYPGLYHELYREVDLIVANTHYTKQLLLSNGASEHKILVVPVPLNPGIETVPKAKRADDLVRIVYVGRLVDFKGADRIPQIARLIQSKTSVDFEILVIGEGDLQDTLLNEIQAQDVDKHVKMLGGLPHEKVLDAMQQSDIFLLPGIVTNNGRAENQGLVVQEAQAIGLPVVVTDTGGVAEGVIDGETGYVVPWQDTEMIADRLVQLMEDASLREEMGNAARNFVLDRYNYKKLAQQVIDAIEKSN